MARLMTPGISRWLLGVLASAAMVAAVSGLVALLEPYVPRCTCWCCTCWWTNVANHAGASRADFPLAATRPARRSAG
jgi:hypothetical protein